MINEKRKTEELLNSSQAAFLVPEEIKSLKDIFKKHEEEIIQKTQNWHIKYRANRHNGVDIISYGYMLYFHFYQQWANTLTDDYLFMVVFKGYTDEQGNVTDPFAENRGIDSIKLKFDIDELNQRGWSKKR